jgi:DDE family transposase
MNGYPDGWAEKGTHAYWAKREADQAALRVQFIKERLFKIGARLVRHARYFTLQLAESYLTGSLFRQILQRIERLAWHPT